MGKPVNQVPCGHVGTFQGAKFGPVSPCVLPVGHVRYHSDSKGLAFGPWTAEEDE